MWKQTKFVYVALQSSFLCEADTVIGILLGRDYPKDETYAKNVKMKDRKRRFLINIIMKQQK